MRASWLLATAFFLFLGPSALADSIDVSFSSSVMANVSSPNDSYWGTYYNVASRPFFVGNPSISTIISVPFSNLSVFLPAGSTFLDAEVSFMLPNNVIGTGQAVAETPFGPAIDPHLPSIAPTFSDNGVVKVSTNIFHQGPNVVVNGNEVSTAFPSFSLILEGSLQPALVDTGSNWAGFIGGDGQVDIPYTVNLDVTYSPVPEPSSFFLFGTGALGLLGIFRSKTFQKN